jgi:segregation and condensation protein B
VNEGGETVPESDGVSDPREADERARDELESDESESDESEWGELEASERESSEREWEARRAIEAVVLATVEPVEPRLLAQLVELPVSRVEALCEQLAAEYEEQGRGFVLARVAGGYRFQTHPDAAAYVERFVLEGQHARLSPPALETLAIVAYKQPISRGQMSAIRGVNVEATLTTLLQRGYVQEVGRDPGPGAAVLYGTTRTFLERLGLDSLDELPPLGDFVPDPSVVEALERGLRIADDPAAGTATAEEGAGAGLAADAATERAIEDAVEGVLEEQFGDAVIDLATGVATGAATDESTDAEADALLRDDPAGPLD